MRTLPFTVTPAEMLEAHRAVARVSRWTAALPVLITAVIAVYFAWASRSSGAPWVLRAFAVGFMAWGVFMGVRTYRNRRHATDDLLRQQLESSPDILASHALTADDDGFHIHLPGQEDFVIAWGLMVDGPRFPWGRVARTDAMYWPVPDRAFASDAERAEFWQTYDAWRDRPRPIPVVDPVVGPEDTLHRLTFTDAAWAARPSPVQRPPWRPLLLGAALALAAIAAGSLPGAAGVVLFTLGLWGALVCAVILGISALPTLAAWNGARQHRQLREARPDRFPADAVLRVGPAGIRMHARTGRSQLPWHGIARVVDRGGWTFLVTSRNQWFIVPEIDAALGETWRRWQENARPPLRTAPRGEPPSTENPFAPPS